VSYEFGEERERWEYVKDNSIVKNRYKVSDKGRVFDEENERFLQPTFNMKTGFMSVSLRKRSGSYKNILMHRLVFQTFKPEEFKEAEAKKWLIKHDDGSVRKNHLTNLSAAPPSVVRKQRTQEISRLRGMD
jgi:hypothetical protein